MTVHVGNDIVDLLDPRCAGKSSDPRFLDRVFTDREVEVINGSDRPDESLWTAWAAKEAAFKVVTKLGGSPPPFRHAAFEFLPAPRAPSAPERGELPRPGRHPGPDRPPGPDQPDETGNAHESGEPTPAAGVRAVEGRVEYRRAEIPVAGVVQSDRIHLVAWYPGAEESPAIRSRVELLPEPGGQDDRLHMESVRDRFTAREWRSIHRSPSALVRLSARKHLAEVLGVGERDLEIVCDDGLPGRMPPYVLISGERWRGDISLSHHGRLLAWALLAPVRGPDPNPNGGLATG